MDTDTRDTKGTFPLWTSRLCVRKLMEKMVMSQTGVKGATIAMLLACLMLAGCRDRLQEVESLSRDAVVVVKCACEARRASYNGLELHFRVAEIWRDASNGMFTNKVGDVLDECTIGLADDDPTPHEAVLFFGSNDSGLCQLVTSFVNGGYLHGMPVEQVRHIIATTSASGEQTKVLMRPR